MKRFFNLSLVILFCLSGCTPGLSGLIDVDIEVSFLEDQTLLFLLKDVSEGYSITIDGEEFSCEQVDDPPDQMVCVGPAFELGQVVTLRISKKEGDQEPIHAERAEGEVYRRSAGAVRNDHEDALARQILASDARAQ